MSKKTPKNKKIKLEDLSQFQSELQEYIQSHKPQPQENKKTKEQKAEISPAKADSQNLSQEDEEKLFLKAIDQLDQNEIRKKLSSEQKKRQTRRNLAKQGAVIKIDLHGLILADAKTRVKNTIDQALTQNKSNRSITFEIITGKGRNSPQGGVLLSEIPDFCRKTYSDQLIFIDSEGLEKVHEDLPFKGSFLIQLKS